MTNAIPQPIAAPMSIPRRLPPPVEEASVEPVPEEVREHLGARGPRAR